MDEVKELEKELEAFKENIHEDCQEVTCPKCGEKLKIIVIKVKEPCPVYYPIYPMPMPAPSNRRNQQRRKKD